MPKKEKDEDARKAKKASLRKSNGRSLPSIAATAIDDVKNHLQLVEERKEAYYG